MNTLFILDEKNYTDDMPVFEKYAVRAIICKDAKYAMQRGKAGECKIPGGTVEIGETFFEALAREVLEETGLIVIQESIKEIGEVTEIREDAYKKGQKYICHSLIYRCDVQEEIHETNMTTNELIQGYQLSWVSLEEIINTNNKLQKNFRDTKFFEYYKLNFK